MRGLNVSDCLVFSIGHEVVGEPMTLLNDSITCLRWIIFCYQ